MKFSHIYIETKAIDYPIAKSILEKIKETPLIQIKNYKDVFNRSKQDFTLQKKFPKLILAKKESQFLYEGSKLTPDFGNKNFFYNSLVFNCIYNCDYCYLQGMYPSAYIVIFVNIEDFFSSIEDKLNSSSIYLSASYDTDLLAFEKIYPFVSQWIEFARKTSGLLVEIRTKSSNFKEIQNISPTENMILAWTLSPKSIIQSYENKTPTLNQRLNSALAAINAGWKVRLCFDPVLIIPNYEFIYKEFFKQVFSVIPENKILDISTGVFRINSDYHKKIQKFRMDSDILFYNFEEFEGIISYPEKTISNTKDFLYQELKKYSDKKIDFTNPF